VFDEAARHECFKQAAESLFVTQSAVSKQILRLEKSLGVALFKRKYGGAKLTSEGKAFYEAIFPAMDMIEHANKIFVAPNDEELLGVNIPHSMGFGWMHSKISAFHENFPNFPLRVFCDDDVEAVSRHGIDVGITCLETETEMARELEPLFEEELVLVMSRNLLSSRAVNRVQDLIDYPLIGQNDRPDIWDKLFQRHGVIGRRTACRYSFQHFFMVQKAVESSLGVGLVPRYLCQSLIESGLLYNPLGLSTKSGFSYYMQIPVHKREFRKVILFSNWLRNEICLETTKFRTAS